MSLLFTQQGLGQQQIPADRVVTEMARHEQGREIYNFRCYYCHGYSGDAQTLAATFLEPRPRDFSATDPAAMTRSYMLDVVARGKEGTAMRPFDRTLTSEEIGLVVDFVRQEFMHRADLNTNYHTVANGWPEHERYAVAYPFATGEIALDRPWNVLTPAQQAGKRLFMTSCVSCHDHARVEEAGEIWRPEAVSYPRTGFKPGDSSRPPDQMSGPSPYARHDVPPVPDRPLSEFEQSGERLFQQNCAFCHGADGSGKNWIGTFLQPGARDLTDRQFMRGMTPERLRQVIRDGLAGTSMPAWRSVLTTQQIDQLVAYIDAVIHPLARE